MIFSRSKVSENCGCTTVKERQITPVGISSKQIKWPFQVSAGQYFFYLGHNGLKKIFTSRGKSKGEQRKDSKFIVTTLFKSLRCQRSCKEEKKGIILMFIVDEVTQYHRFRAERNFDMFSQVMSPLLNIFCVNLESLVQVKIYC